MPNGKPSDHPLTDIIIHDRRVYSERADDLIRKIVAFGARRELENLLFAEYNDWDNPDVKKLEEVLTKIYERILAENSSKGSDVG